MENLNSLIPLLKKYFTFLIKDQEKLNKLIKDLDRAPLDTIKKILRTRFELFAYWGLQAICREQEVDGFFQKDDDDFAYFQELAGFFTRMSEGDGRYLLINMPPRLGKTQMSKLFVAWTFGRNPFSKFLYLCMSEELASDGVSKISSYIKHPAYKSIFPKVIIDKNLDNRKRFQILMNGMPCGELYGTSVLGSITGFGAGNRASINGNSFKFSGAIIIDDPIKTQDAQSETSRDGVWNAIENTILSRKNSSSTPVIMIMQRLHSDDPSGRFIKRFKNNPDFRHICLKAYNNEQSICPAKLPIKDLLELEASDPFTFYSQYQQDPLSATNRIFDVKSIKFVGNEIDDGLILKSFIAVDTAEKDTKNSDFSVFGHFYLVAANNWRDYVIRGVNGELQIPDYNNPKIIKLVLNEIYVKRIPAHAIGEEFDHFYLGILQNIAMPPSIILVEEQGSGLALIGYLKRNQNNKKYHNNNEFLVTGIRQKNSKILRMRSVAQLIKDGVFCIRRDECRKFKNYDSTDIAIINHMDSIENKDNKKDDIADVITYGLESSYYGISSADNKFLGKFFHDGKNLLINKLIN